MFDEQMYLETGFNVNRQNRSESRSCGTTQLPFSGGGHYHARHETYGLIYCPDSQPFAVNLDKLPAKQLKAWWFNPRTGTATAIGTLNEKGRKQFTPPAGPNPYNDWVLVLDDASRNFPPPGSK